MLVKVIKVIWRLSFNFIRIVPILRTKEKELKNWQPTTEEIFDVSEDKHENKKVSDNNIKSTPFCRRLAYFGFCNRIPSLSYMKGKWKPGIKKIIEVKAVLSNLRGLTLKSFRSLATIVLPSDFPTEWISLPTPMEFRNLASVTRRGMKSSSETI